MDNYTNLFFKFKALPSSNKRLIMADSLSLDKSMTRDSDNLPDNYCEPCQDVEGKYTQAVALCKDCAESLCSDCVSAHKKQKISRNHQIEYKTSVSSTTPKIRIQKSIPVKCHQHPSEAIRSYCRSCDQLCCKICQTVDHHDCKLENISAAAAGIKESKQLCDLTEKLAILKKGYDNNLSKAEKQSVNIEKSYSEAISDIRKLQETFEKLSAETERHAETLKDNGLNKMDALSLTCNILVEQIDKLSFNITEQQDKGENETLFISMKRAEGQLQSLEDRLNKLDEGNTINECKFEPDRKLNDRMNELKSLGTLSYSTISSSGPMLKTPLLIKDIDVRSTNIRGFIILPNKQLVLTDSSSSTVMLVDTERDTIISELQLSAYIWDVTRVKSDEIAITNYSAKKILYVSVSSNKLSVCREMSVDGECTGIEYNDQDETLIVTFNKPIKVEILSLTGTVIKRIDKDASGAQQFSCPWYVALSHDKTMMYVTDHIKNSVTLMTLNGDVKVVYKGNGLQHPTGISVHRSGIVYVAGSGCKTVHQILPGSDKLESLLKLTNSLTTVTYSDTEDKLYVGQNGTIKVFKMK